MNRPKATRRPRRSPKPHLIELQCATGALAFALADPTITDKQRYDHARRFLLALAQYQAHRAEKLPRAEHVDFARHWIAGRDEGERLRARFPALRDQINAEHQHRFELARALERDWIAAGVLSDHAERVLIAGAIVAFVAEHTEPVARSVAEHADAVQFAAAILEESKGQRN